jgi:hypothetical protein
VKYDEAKIPSSHGLFAGSGTGHMRFSFWSSSVNSNNPDDANEFNGNNGDVDNNDNNRNDNNSVRCVAE